MTPTTRLANVSRQATNAGVLAGQHRAGQRM